MHQVPRIKKEGLQIKGFLMLKIFIIISFLSGLLFSLIPASAKEYGFLYASGDGVAAVSHLYLLTKIAKKGEWKTKTVASILGLSFVGLALGKQMALRCQSQDAWNIEDCAYSNAMAISSLSLICSFTYLPLGIGRMINSNNSKKTIAIETLAGLGLGCLWHFSYSIYHMFTEHTPELELSSFRRKVEHDLLWLLPQKNTRSAEFNKWMKSGEFSPNGAFLAAGSSGNTAKIWKLANGTLMHTLQQNKLVRSVAFNLDNKHLATGSWDEFKIWDIISGDCLYTLSLPRWDWKKSCVASHGTVKAFVVTGGSAGYVNILIIDQSENLAKLKFRLVHGETIKHIAFSADGALLFSVSLSFTKIWDMGTGKLLYTLKRI